MAKEYFSKWFSEPCMKITRLLVRRLCSLVNRSYTLSLKKSFLLWIHKLKRPMAGIKKIWQGPRTLKLFWDKAPVSSAAVYFKSGLFVYWDLQMAGES